jgi:Ni/Co efflux regulator RcnB
MKKLITAALALSLLGAAGAQAQPQDDHHDNGQGRPVPNRAIQVPPGSQGRAGPQGAPQATPQAGPRGAPQAVPQAAPPAAPQGRPQGGPQDRGQGPGNRPGAPGFNGQGPNGQGAYGQGYRAPEGRGQGDRGQGYDGQNYGRPGFNGGGREWRAPQRFQGRPYAFPRGFGLRAWSFGEYLPGPYFEREYVLYDYWSYGLPQPPAGFEWLRVGSDALLVRPVDGYILDVAQDLFW